MTNKIIELIADELSIDKNSINAQTSLKDDLNVDSLDVVELIMRIEETFDITVDDEDSDKLSTVGDIINYVKGLKS